MSIQIENLRKTFRGPDGEDVAILNIQNLQIQDGEQVCLVGGSGSGKTTLLNVIAGITVPTSGRVLIHETDITSLAESTRDRFRAANIGYVFQTFNLLQGLTAIENVAIAGSFAGRSESESRARAEELLSRMRLDHRLKARPGTMSVGEQQRVALARALMNRPKVVLADEPTANLDEKNGDEVLRLLRESAAKEKSILILVTHDSRVRAGFERTLPLAELSA